MPQEKENHEIGSVYLQYSAMGEKETLNLTKKFGVETLGADELHDFAHNHGFHDGIVYAVKDSNDLQHWILVCYQKSICI